MQSLPSSAIPFHVLGRVFHTLMHKKCPPDRTEQAKEDKKILLSIPSLPLCRRSHPSRLFPKSISFGGNKSKNKENMRPQKRNSKTSRQMQKVESEKDGCQMVIQEKEAGCKHV